MTLREGNLEAPTRHPIDWQGADYRDEGFTEIADWFETLAKAERSHANRFQKALDALTD